MACLLSRMRGARARRHCRDARLGARPMLLYKHPASGDNADHTKGEPHGRTRQSPQHRKSQGPAGRAGADRKAVRQGLDHAAGRRRGHRGHPGRLHRLARPRHRARRRRPAARPGGRDLRPRVVGQDHAHAAGHRRDAEAGRHLRLHRCRARARLAVRAKARRQPAGAADLPARHRRAGARDRRRAGALGLGRPDRHRLGRRAHAEGRDRRRDGRFAARPAGAPDEPGAAQAHRHDQEDQHAWSSSSTRSA